MGQLGNVVLGGDGVHDFAAQIQDDHYDQGQRDGAVAHPRQRGEDDHHKHDAAGPQQGGGGEENKLHQPGDKGGDHDAAQQPLAAVFLFQRRSYHQKEHHVAHKVGVVRVAQHMGEHAQIGEGVGERGAIDGEQQPGGPLSGELAQSQCSQGEQEEGEYHRRIILNSQLFHVSGSAPALESYREWSAARRPPHL